MNLDKNLQSFNKILINSSGDKDNITDIFYSPKVLIQELVHCYSAPVKATIGSAGYDLFAANEEDIVIQPGQIIIVPTGIILHLDLDENTLYEAQIRSRSGLSFKHGIVVLNAPGTIDADYKGEVKVVLINHHKTESFTIKRGFRIAQMVIQPIYQFNLLIKKNDNQLNNQNLNDEISKNSDFIKKSIETKEIRKDKANGSIKEIREIEIIKKTEDIQNNTSFIKNEVIKETINTKKVRGDNGFGSTGI